MKRGSMRIWGRALSVFSCAVLTSCFVSVAHGRGADTHLCQIIPGETVAEAVQGRISETRAAEGRCIYFVTMPEGSGSAAFVIYQHPAEDYQGLREVLGGEITKIDGLGDEAVLTREDDGSRSWLLTTLRGKVTLQVSGDDANLVRQVGTAALQQFADR